MAVVVGRFLLFRFFDIVKPWPIRQLDKKVSGGFGIMIDDVVAALFTLSYWLSYRFVNLPCSTPWLNRKRF